MSADAALLVAGNDRTSAVNALAAPFAGDPWILVDKTDDGGNLLQDVAFTVAGDLNARSGAWQLSWNGPGLPLVADLLLVFKAAGDWGAYLFEDLGFTESHFGGDFAADGTFDITWRNRGGRIPGLSHISVYARPGELGELPPGGPTTTPVRVGTTDVPVPDSLLLFGLGLTLLTRKTR